VISYKVLSTGSNGNAVIIGRSVLVDCGVSYRMIEPYINDIRLVLLTHIHGDHFNPATIRHLSKERPLLRFGACRWLIKPLVDSGVRERQIDVFDTGYSYEYGICKVIPFPLVHDVPNCGYKLHFPGGKAIYATDTGNLDGITAKDYDLYLIESNYEAAEIMQRIAEKKLNGQYAYEYRVLNTHLSKERCEDFIAKNIGSVGEYVYLHTHREDEDDSRAEGYDKEPGREMGYLILNG